MTENSIAVNEMFCFQCQETAKGIACTIKGVCGKSSSTSAAMDCMRQEQLNIGSHGLAVVRS